MRIVEASNSSADFPFDKAQSLSSSAVAGADIVPDFYITSKIEARVTGKLHYDKISHASNALLGRFSI